MKKGDKGMRVWGAILVLVVLLGCLTSAPAVLSQDNSSLPQLSVTSESYNEGTGSQFYSAGKFSIGDVVRVVSSVGVKVRETPAGSYIKTEPYNTVGIILDESQGEWYGGVYYTWWNVRYEDGVEGWSAEGYPGGVAYLEKKYVLPSVNFSIGDKVEVYNTGSYGLIVRTDPPELAYKGMVWDGDKGTVTDGPFYGTLKDKEGCWHFWKFDFGSIVGWCAEDYLKKVPDLIVDDIWIEPTEFGPGDTVDLRVRIKNIGDADAEGFALKRYIDDSYNAPPYGVEGLAAGWSATLPLPWSLNWPSDCNSHKIKVWIDADEVVEESNENNNVLSISFSAKCVHDMAVTNVYTSPSSPKVGESTTIYVTVKNEGTQQETSVPVKAYVDGAQKGSTQYVTLSADQSTTKSFSWTPDTDKTYSVKGEVGIVSGETETDDNSDTISVIVNPSPRHDMAVTDVYTSPSSPNVGQSTTIYVTVKNEGSQQENSVPVKAYVDGSQIDTTKYVSLSPDSSDTKSFAWTPDTDKTYFVKGEVGIVTDETDTADNSITISVQTKSPAKPVLIFPLKITPEKDTYYVGDTLTAKFTIKNIGDVQITLDKLLVGGRFNGGKLPNGEYPDFTFQSTTLQPDVPYQFEGTLELTHSGIYQFFIAYYIENPTPEEKELLDENNWNTCVDLGEGLTDEDRTEDIIVLKKTNPTAIILGGPYRGDVNQPIQFHGSATGGIPPYTAYEWTFYDRDKVVKVADQHETANYTWSTPSTEEEPYYAELRVKDSVGDDWSEPKGCDVHVYEPFTFVQVTDTHIGSGGLRWNAKQRLSEAILEINKMDPKPDFVLVTGDVVEYASKKIPLIYEWDAGNFKQFNDALASLDPIIKVYIVPGNHDRYVHIVDSALMYTSAEGLKYYHQNIDAKQFVGYQELIPPDNYTFEHKGYCFIGLDSGEDVNPWDYRGTGLSDDQIEKLPKNKYEGWPKIIFMHHPVFNDDDWGIIKNNSDEFIDYCKGNNVQLVLTGHTHADKIFDADSGGDIKKRPLFIQTPSATKDTRGEWIGPVPVDVVIYPHGYRIIEIKKSEAFPHSYKKTESHSGFWARLFSPANLHAYDSQGRHTGINASTGEIERNIPNSFYFGRYNLSNQNESEMILLYNMSDSHRFEIVSNLTTKQQMQAGIMTSPLSGSFNFTLEKQTNDTLTTISFINVSIQENTTASVSVNPINPVEAHSVLKASPNYTMEIDLDGDGTIDERKDPDSIETDYAPTATIISPVNNSVYLYGDEIAFNGTGTDLEDGILTNTSLVWSSSINGVIGTGNDFNTTNLSVGMHLIELMVNDTSGQIGLDNVTITVIAPDLAINMLNSSFSNPYPIEGESIIITATVHNIGTANATNVTVQFFDGSPLDGTKIEANPTIASINAGEYKNVSVAWNTTGEAGDNCIWVVVDSSNSIKESDEGNNQANKSIFVSAPQVLHILQAQTDRAAYVENEVVLITCIVQNASINISANVSADIEKTDGIMDNITLIEGIAGNYNGLFMNTSLSGTYNITIYANRTGFIGDNESLSFEVLDTTPPASITNITNTTGSKWINWTWDNPSDSDFGYTLIYLNGTWKTATPKGYYLAEGLDASTEYKIETWTVDTEGNINETWVNQTAKTSENQPPIASFTYSPGTPVVNQMITFNASNSTDPDGNITTYNWTFGDENTTSTTEPIITYFYASAGDYIVNLTVTDDDGATNSTSIQITVSELGEFIFDTGSGTYPSISGTHNGTITPNQTINISKLYTYPCPGTGGHTESIELYENNILIANGTWNGYVSDWHNLTIHNVTTGAPYIMLLKEHGYNYTLRTGSYPQIIHAKSKDAIAGAGTITCDKFVDANGKEYTNWIPAIKLFL